MRNSLDYAGLAQLCARSPIMRKIMRAHNRIIQPSLVVTCSPQIAPSPVWFGPHMTWFLIPTRVHTPNSFLIYSAVLDGLVLCPADTQTMEH